MISAQFRIQLPEGVWIREISEQHPDATFDLLSGYRRDETAIELGEIVTDDPEAPIETFRSHPSIDRLEVLESTGERALAKYELTDTALYEFVDLTALPIEFPVIARNGWFEFDLTGTRAELEQLRSVLDSLGATYELQSLVSGTDTESLLTDRQRELLELGIRQGYYEVPRECTLTELAEEANVDKATASTVMRRGETKLVKWFLNGPERKREFG
ncbi:helix-turn-helix domain-containing protein [Natronolimnohabitans sp. A-GB9]|uniref:helix-turn-helix domain-containing protein n=1 Tax=Natronolimnohabitans sp. A-GB9 TaxID=3069757 RepID=UPI0027B84D67|nr:helix-turn-helix domain-containing protein [Natronolimnohabitans sp. A-GB9]MDQ2052183.1 helix-turn-helix domain-containing protein [Natronolimnohabitans sp. A-GB9]